MEQKEITPSQAASDDSTLGRPNVLPDSGAAATLPDKLIDKALPAGRDRRGNRAQRADGWTPPRIRAFLEVLARSGSVAAAARAAGMSRQSAYALRRSAKGQAFDDAWRHAVLIAGPCFPDDLMERAINGCIDPIVRKGKLVGKRHRFDNRLSLRLLRRLDILATSKSPAARTLRAIAEDFHALVDIVCAGDDEQADAFLRSRCGAHRRGETQMPNLSTLPGPPTAETVAPTGSPELSEGPASRCEQPDMSTLRADPLPGILLDKAA